jgi:hypothetical protein
MMRRAVLFVLAVAAVFVASWLLPASPAAAFNVSITGSHLIAAGDIASCASEDDSATAALIGTRSGTVAALGDNADPYGSNGAYDSCYGPTWGQFKARTRPTPGNHEYRTFGAAGYFDYFGAAAGPPTKGYYSYTLGSWHVVVLNSNCGAVAGGCGVGSPQERWLRADLTAHPTACTVAYWHHPLFASGLIHNGAPSVRPLYQALYDAGAEVVLNADALNYERFAPQNEDGVLDPAFGIREFVVGTGGISHELFGIVRPNSEVRNGSAFGILRLTLGAGAYSWQFSSTPNVPFTDSGTGTCHGVPNPAPAPTLVAAGEISTCTGTGDSATAAIVAHESGTVAALGDLTGPFAPAAAITDCYGPTWGQFRTRTRPTPGDREYNNTPGARPYFSYFGALAGDPTKGYYSYNIGAWHVVVLNSYCNEVGGCGVGSLQEQWLRSDLASHQSACTLAYWHAPLFTSRGPRRGIRDVRPLFQALFDWHAEIVLNGHEHQYERFAPQDSTGHATASGIREFVVGTGGQTLVGFGETQPNSEVRIADTWGVLRLTLRANSYDWQFLPVTGQTSTDSGTTNCH